MKSNEDENKLKIINLINDNNNYNNKINDLMKRENEIILNFDIIKKENLTNVELLNKEIVGE